MIRLDNVSLALVFERQTESQSHPLYRRELAVKRPITLRIARYLVKKNSGSFALPAFGEHLGNRAHLPVPMRAVDLLQLTHVFDLLDPVAQAPITDIYVNILNFCRMQFLPPLLFNIAIYSPTIL